MALMQISDRIFVSCEAPGAGELAALFSANGVTRVIGHPTFRNENNIGDEIKRDIRAVTKQFPQENVAICVSDGTWTEDSKDDSTLKAAIAGARDALVNLTDSQRKNLLLVAVPYDGYAGNHTPGKGSALKLLYEEVSRTPSVKVLILLDGDLKNDFDPWFRVFREVEQEHAINFPEKSFFITARYARHFVDASLTRFVVGPLTTIMGVYVPGGISGDIVLSQGAVRRECLAEWDDHRRRYGTDIATTFDNIADPDTQIYEVYLGAKLHDVTDESKLAVMPGEVIGAALKQIITYEKERGQVKRVLSGNEPLRRPIVWDSRKTGIPFIDPGYTDVFDVDVKRTVLVERYPEFRKEISKVLLPESFHRVEKSYKILSQFEARDEDPVTFLGIDRDFWIELLYEHIAFLLSTEDVESTKRSMVYLYSAAFCEFCKEKLAVLGAKRLGEVRALQRQLGVPADKAEEFYRREVDAVVDQMAMEFYEGRKRILELMEKR
ncbi:hypothetical protein [Thermodesulforhabdus norvegica]|uniref:Uncharacterized protein n=1 Tax=Thermodesulforhabdus norvegica TaxID=39841 RepID=A0A1I4RHD9_9BACT|nr:hypothetical protein [Thermodesulforhabdus norvegica]SFM51637.1 hypothetical protein SAMN05660836_00620 [Thermodesulforhabdus norvegica]